MTQINYNKKNSLDPRFLEVAVGGYRIYVLV